MTLPVPNQRTWATLDVVTAAMMNANVRDAVNFLTAPPLAILYQTVGQSLANNTAVPLTWDSELVDTYNGHSTTTNTSRYTAQVAGYYDIIGRISWAGAVDTKRIALVTVNGASYRNCEMDAPTTNLGHTVVDTTVFLNVGDYVELQGYQGTGASITTNVSSTAYGSSLDIRWVHS